GEQEADHQQRCRDRPEDERPRRAHRASTLVPCCSLSMPSVTTVSPAESPLLIAVSSPSVSRISTGRISTLRSAFTAYTNVDCGVRWTAAVGTITVSRTVPSNRRAFTNWFGKSALFLLAKVVFTFTVPVV